MSVAEGPSLADPVSGDREQLARREAYWLDRLSGGLPETNLTPDFVRRRGGAKSYDSLPFQLPKDLSRSTHRRAEGDANQVFSILAAAALLVPHRYTGQETLIVGAPAPGPSRGDGASPGIVALLTHIPADDTITDYMQRVSDTVREAYRHGGVPLARLLDALGLRDDGDRCPVFDIFVVLEDIHGRDAARQVDTDLTLRFRICGEHVEGELRYRLDVFAQGTIKRFITHFKRILRFALHEGNAPVSLIPLLTEAERRAILRLSEGLARSYPTDKTIHALFEEQAALWPDRVAVEDQTQQLSYRQLNETANRIANLLIELGAKPNEFVAVLHERSVTNLVFMLAAMKAGGAFVSIDPSYPPDRVSYMLENSEARFLLTSSETMERYFSAIEQCMGLDFVVLPDRGQIDDRSPDVSSIKTYDGNRLAACSRTNPRAGTSGRDLCYMIYTSGSTGLPKGAMVRHDGAVNHIYAEFSALKFTSNFSMIQSAPASSDISIWQYLGPVLIGGRVVVVDTATVLDAEALLGVMQDKKVSLVEFVPVVMRNLMEHAAGLAPSQRALPHLRWMMATGEAVSVDLVNWWLSLYPSIGVVNAYGPSEASDDVAQMTITRPLPPAHRSVPIGRPLANCIIYIVDRNMELVPRGVPGEICVAGICVGNGYWKNEEKTAAAFVANPFVGTAAGMLYRTGDLGRWLSDGTIEFLGRIDQQVKVRGFRIELEEVEAVLREHPDVRDVAAQVWEDARGVRRLAAHVVTAPGKEPMPSKWRRFMLRKLPDYMVPAIFASIDRLPLAPSGKVDRRALPEPQGDTIDLQATYVAPHSPAERILAEIWAEILQIDQVGIKDNFFELGGDSILSIQVTTRACKAGVILKPPQIFTNPTIEQLARAADAAALPLPPSAPSLMPLTPAQLQILQPADQPPVSPARVVGLELSQPIDWPRMQQALRAVVRHHPALRVQVVETADGWRQCIGEQDDIPAVADGEQTVSFDDAALAAVRTAGGRLAEKLDPASGVVCAAGFVDFGPARPSWLVLATHGIAADTESWPIVVEDLETAYRQLGDGQPVALLPEDVPFAQWMMQATTAQRPHSWARQATAPLDAQEQPVATEWLAVEETSVVDEVAERMNARIEEMCAAALTMISAPDPDSPSLTLHVVASRQPGSEGDLNLSRTVGCLTTSLSVSLELDREDDLVVRLKSTKERLRRAGIPDSRSPAQDDDRSDDETGTSDSTDRLWHVALVPGEAMDPGAVSRTSSLFRRVEVCLDQAQPRPAAGTEIRWQRVDDRLGFTVAFGLRETPRRDVERYLREFLDALHRMTEHCRAADARGYTPSDFPLSGIDQAGIDTVQRQFPDIEDMYPLGPAQQGVYLHCLLARKPGPYIEQTSVDLRGDLDQETLFRAWQAVTRRYPALRTAFARRRLPRPLQVVCPTVAAGVHSHDWRQFSPQEQAELWLEFLEKDRASPLVMAELPLHRLTLVRLADDLHRLLLTYHHLIMDGWSETIVLRDLFRVYRRIQSGQGGELPVDNTYRTYIAWLVGQDETAARAFWRGKLEGFTTPTRLTIEKDAVEPAGFECLTRRLSAGFTQDLHSFARRHQFTVNTVLQAAWALIHHLYSSSMDVVYGTVVSGRQAPIPGMESLVGMAINTLPVRVHIRPDDSLDTLLRQLQNELSDIQEFGYSTLVDLQRMSDVPYDAQPLLRSLFVFANYPEAATIGEEFDHPSVENVQLITIPDFPLTFFAVPDDRFLLRIVYERGRFDHADIKDALSRYVEILESLLANAHGNVGSVMEGAGVPKALGADPSSCPERVRHRGF